eukprot:gene20845-40756_t
MQMGRWFGYRPGYVDLCRLYTTYEIFEWFNHITMATEEMRNDFDEMSAALQKPKDFKLKVRNHHGLLTITSIAKLGFSKTEEISFSDIELICEFLKDFQIELPSIINATLSEYIKKQSSEKEIKEWSICIISNSDEKVFINRFENNPDDSRIPKDDVFTYELSHSDKKIKIGCS